MNTLRNRAKDKKGFTLAELLIVVAIIGVLVAISIPIFTAQLKKARLATNQANARAAYAAVMAETIQNGVADGKAYKYETGTGALTATSAGGTSVNGTDISGWTVENNTALGAAVYNVWGITLNDDGSISGYTYGTASSGAASQATGS